jgi:hypothetical protein
MLGFQTNLTSEKRGEGMENQDNQVTKNVSDLSIRQILGLLRPKELWAVIIALITIISASFYLGTQLEKVIYKTPIMAPTDPIEEFNAFEKTLRDRPSIRVFEEYLIALAKHKWKEAWERSGTDEKERRKSSDNLARWYRMTQSHECLNYIPLKISDREEVYLVDFQFADLFPELPVRERLIKGRLDQVLKETDFQDYVNELTAKLAENFEVPSGDRVVLTQKIQNSIATMSIRDLVIEDAIIDVLGNKFEYKPIVMEPRKTQGQKFPISKRRLVEAHMIKESEYWKVDFYESITLEKK